jgi:hypothetical protein
MDFLGGTLLGQYRWRGVASKCKSRYRGLSTASAKNADSGRDDGLGDIKPSSYLVILTNGRGLLLVSIAGSACTGKQQVLHYVQDDKVVVGEEVRQTAGPSLRSG